MKRLTILILMLGLGGCSLLPSGLHIFGTPLDKQQKRQAQESAARSDVLGAVQENVHKSGLALAAAPDSRPVAVAKDFLADAEALLDQAKGAPSASDTAKWRDLVTRLLSENEQVRAAAEAARSRDSARMDALADKLTSAEAARVRADAAVTQYAKANEALADWVRKIGLVLALLLFLWLLGQGLGIAAKLNPAFAGASGIINGIAAPAVQFALSRAKSGLQKVGAAMSEIRAATPEVAAKVEAVLDQHLDSDHKQIVSAAATAAGNGPA